MDRPPEAGVEVVTPNPFTSGGAPERHGGIRRVAARGAAKQAQANLLKLFKNVVVQDKSARDSLNTFMSGKGDVLLAYENEALFSKLKSLASSTSSRALRSSSRTRLQ